jgi:hypothetical protein
MKYFYVLIVGLVTLVVSPNSYSSHHKAMEIPAKKNFHLFLLAGQSNMAGRGIIEDEDKVAHPRVLMLNEDREWVPAVAPIHFDKKVAGVGLGKSFAVTLAENNPDITIGLIPAACGGSPISSWEPGGYHHQTKSPPYDDAISRTRSALKDGVLKGILWHQGESDCKPGLSDVYQKKLAELIKRFRSDLRIKDLPVIIGQLGKFADKPWSAERIEVDKAHQSIARSMDGVGFVTSEDLTPNEDIVHFDTPSLRIFGKRYAQNFLKTDEEVEEERGKSNRYHRSGFARKRRFEPTK